MSNERAREKIANILFNEVITYNMLDDPDFRITIFYSDGTNVDIPFNTLTINLIKNLIQILQHSDKLVLHTFIIYHNLIYLHKGRSIEYDYLEEGRDMIYRTVINKTDYDKIPISY